MKMEQFEKLENVVATLKSALESLGHNEIDAAIDEVTDAKELIEEVLEEEAREEEKSLEKGITWNSAACLICTKSRELGEGIRECKEAMLLRQLPTAEDKTRYFTEVAYTGICMFQVSTPKSRGEVEKNK